MANTLCWSCKNSIGYCSWSKDFTPVDGWEAEKTKLKLHSGGYDTSYAVKKCPLYIWGGDCDTNNTKHTSQKHPLIAINKDTGEKTEFKSIKEAAIHTGCNKSSIGKCLAGIYKYTKNYIFVSLKEEVTHE
jgi:hypothetical protein